LLLVLALLRLRLRGLRFILLESNQTETLHRIFKHIFNHLKEVQQGEEPMINMLSYYDKRWQILIFPRARHRPRQYFEEGEGNILISPAAVDLGGTLIMPLEKDFLKISKEDIADKTTSEKVAQLRRLREEQYEKLKDAVYERRGWTEDGIPTVKTVKRLGIDFPEVLDLLASNGVEQ